MALPSCSEPRAGSVALPAFPQTSAFPARTLHLRSSPTRVTSKIVCGVGLGPRQNGSRNHSQPFRAASKTVAAIVTWVQDRPSLVLKVTQQVRLVTQGIISDSLHRVQSIHEHHVDGNWDRDQCSRRLHESRISALCSSKFSPWPSPRRIWGGSESDLRNIWRAFTLVTQDGFSVKFAFKFRSDAVQVHSVERV